MTGPEVPASKNPGQEDAPGATLIPGLIIGATLPVQAIDALDGSSTLGSSLPAAELNGSGGTSQAAPPGESRDGGRGGYGAVLRNTTFLLVWAAQLLSQTAQNVVNFALVVEVERLTHSSTNVGWVIVSFSLPALLLGLPAGVFVDRVSKRHVLLATNVLRAVLMAAFLVAPQSLVAIYVVTFLASAVSQFFMPAEGAIIPLLVNRKELITATSLFNITFTVSQVAGFVVLGPTLLKLFGSTSVFAAVVVMYVLAAVCVTLIPEREKIRDRLTTAVRRAIHAGSVWGDFLEVRTFLRSSPAVGLAITHLTMATALLLTLATLGPGFVARVLGLNAEDAGLVLAPAGLGMLVTTTLIGQFGASADRRRLASTGLVAMAASMAALALVRPIFNAVSGDLAVSGPGTLQAWQTVVYLGLVVLVTFSLGVEFAFVTIPAQTVISEATEPDLRGRIFAILFMITGSASAVPVLIIGALADRLGIVAMLLCLSLLVALVGAAGFFPLRTRSATAVR